MPTIKGGITLGSKLTEEVKDKLKEAGVKIKLPFAAKGFSCSKIPDGIDTSNIEFKGKSASKPKIAKKKTSKKK